MRINLGEWSRTPFNLGGGLGSIPLFKACRPPSPGGYACGFFKVTDWFLALPPPPPGEGGLAKVESGFGAEGAENFF